MENSQGLPSSHNGQESACRCRGHRFDPWPRKIPHAVERLSQCAATPEPALGAHESQLLKAVHPDPALQNDRRHRKKPDRAAESCPVYSNGKRSARSNKDPVQTEKEKNEERKYLSYNIKKQTYQHIGEQVLIVLSIGLFLSPQCCQELQREESLTLSWWDKLV